MTLSRPVHANFLISTVDSLTNFLKLTLSRSVPADFFLAFNTLTNFVTTGIGRNIGFVDRNIEHRLQHQLRSQHRHRSQHRRAIPTSNGIAKSDVIATSNASVRTNRTNSYHVFGPFDRNSDHLDHSDHIRVCTASNFRRFVSKTSTRVCRVNFLSIRVKKRRFVSASVYRSVSKTLICVYHSSNFCRSVFAASNFCRSVFAASNFGDSCLPRQIFVNLCLPRVKRRFVSTPRQEPEPFKTFLCVATQMQHNFKHLLCPQEPPISESF